MYDELKARLRANIKALETDDRSNPKVFMEKLQAASFCYQEIVEETQALLKLADETEASRRLAQLPDLLSASNVLIKVLSEARDQATLRYEVSKLLNQFLELSAFLSLKTKISLSLSERASMGAKITGIQEELEGAHHLPHFTKIQFELQSAQEALKLHFGKFPVGTTDSALAIAGKGIGMVSLDPLTVAKAGGQAFTGYAEQLGKMGRDAPNLDYLIVRELQSLAKDVGNDPSKFAIFQARLGQREVRHGSPFVYHSVINALQYILENTSNPEIIGGALFGKSQSGGPSKDQPGLAYFVGLRSDKSFPNQQKVNYGIVRGLVFLSHSPNVSIQEASVNFLQALKKKHSEEVSEMSTQATQEYSDLQDTIPSVEERLTRSGVEPRHLAGMVLEILACFSTSKKTMKEIINRMLPEANLQSEDLEILIRNLQQHGFLKRETPICLAPGLANELLKTGQLYEKRLHYAECLLQVADDQFAQGKSAASIKYTKQVIHFLSFYSQGDSEKMLTLKCKALDKLLDRASLSLDDIAMYDPLWRETKSKLLQLIELPPLPALPMIAARRGDGQVALSGRVLAEGESGRPIPDRMQSSQSSSQPPAEESVVQPANQRPAL